ncbi:hypothetical protein SRCM100623_02128 [Acetobacter pasteurianus]|uniref:Uncharacterized protein n=1 Tax=Acetobacter pasteurianus TaxID=438 RepID=A0A1A0D948_ACEPA|nr:hypothetical protein SRCM100623_02128 [Acetobacter pasteurianus]
MDMMAHSVQTASPDTSSEGRGPDCWVGRDQVQDGECLLSPYSFSLILSRQPGRSGWGKCGALRRERSHAQTA